MRFIIGMHMNKNCEVIALWTDGLSYLIIGKDSGKMEYIPDDSHCEDEDLYPVHLYVTSNEKIGNDEEGWLLEDGSIKSVVKFDKGYDHSKYPNDKKIIATTDPELTTCYRCNGEKTIYFKEGGIKGTKICPDCNGKGWNLPKLSKSDIERLVEMYNKGNQFNNIEVRYRSDEDKLIIRDGCILINWEEEEEGIDVQKLADEAYEGCDGCTEFEEKMWKEGFIRGFYVAELKIKNEE